MRELRVEEVAAEWKGAIKIGPFGSALPKSAMVKDGVKVYGQENLIDSDWSLGERRISHLTFRLLQTCELQPGDVVIGMMGSLGHCEIFPAEAEPGLMDSHLLRIQVDRQTMVPEYLRLLLLSEFSTRQIAQLSHGTIMAGLSSKVVRRIRLLVPPVEEQRRVAEILNTIDEAIQATERVVAKRRVFHEGLQQLLVPSAEANADLVPLGSLVDPQRPIVYGILMPGEHVHDGVPVIKVKDIQDRAVAPRQQLLHTHPLIDQQYARSRVRSGDLLFTIRGSVGRMAVVPDNLDQANITQDTARLAVSGVNLTYLLAAMSGVEFRRFVDVHTIGQAVKGINLRELRNAPVRLVDIQEQARAGALLDESYRQLASEQGRARKLRLLRSGLAADLLTGRVRTVAA